MSVTQIDLDDEALAEVMRLAGVRTETEAVNLALCVKPTLLPIIDFTASPLSGIIMGALGPGLSPWVALLNSITDGDGLNQTLANMAGAFFNGDTLDLDSLIPPSGAFCRCRPAPKSTI